jgi:single-strand DNA-binding protein
MTLPTIHATGRLTSDVELRFTGSGKAVASLSIACNESRKDQAGNWETVSTTFLDVDLWESEAEQAAEILRRGSEVTVDGQLQTEEYETKSGEKRRKMKI